MFVVFLDFDGVVNTVMCYKEKPINLQNSRMINRDSYYFDMCSPSDCRVSNGQAIQLLGYLCELYNLKIVITSTWRLGSYERARESLYNSGLSKDVEVVGCTRSDGSMHRGTEIKDYLDNHEVKNFIILDDDIADLEDYKDHVIKTNSYEGITFKIFMDCEEKLKELGIKRD